MKFASGINRPPYESADGYLQTTKGCSHNHCLFCTYFKKFALALAENANIPVILVGGHRSIDNMNNVLNEGKIEYLSLSRPLIREPNIINRWQNGECSPAKCVSCNMCYRTPAHKCIFRLRGIE